MRVSASLEGSACFDCGLSQHVFADIEFTEESWSRATMLADAAARMVGHENHAPPGSSFWRVSQRGLVTERVTS